MDKLCPSGDFEGMILLKVDVRKCINFYDLQDKVSCRRKYYSAGLN